MALLVTESEIEAGAELEAKRAFDLVCNVCDQGIASISTYDPHRTGEHIRKIARYRELFFARLAEKLNLESRGLRE